MFFLLYIITSNYVYIVNKIKSFSFGIEIEENAFYGCTSLTIITIPDSVTSIGNSAFLECNNLTIHVSKTLAKTLLKSYLFNKNDISIED